MATRNTHATGRMLAALALGAVLAGCQTAGLSLPGFETTASTGAPSDPKAKGVTSTAGPAAKDLQQDQPTFTQFSDVPIPANAKINLNETLILGAQEGWIGRLSLGLRFSLAEMYTFYEREMPRFGWSQITAVRAAISTMTYSRDTRIATITLHSGTLGGTTVDFTVAPSVPGSATASAAPRPPVRTTRP